MKQKFIHKYCDKFIIVCFKIERKKSLCFFFLFIFVLFDGSYLFIVVFLFFFKKLTTHIEQSL